MLFVRSALFHFVFYVTLIVMMILGLPVLLLGRRAVMQLSRIWARISLFWLRVLCDTQIEFRGCDNIPQQGFILASKHQSFVEIIAFISIFPDYTFVLKRELMKIPLFGWYLARGGQIPVDRSRGRAALARISAEASRVLGAGRQLFIFPEGTRSAPGAPAHYKHGIAFLYADMAVPCLPVALNSGLFWPRRSFVRRPGKIVIAFLPAIRPGLDRSVFFDILQERIEAESRRLMDEALARYPRLRVGLAAS